MLPKECLLGLGFSMLTKGRRYASMQMETEDHWFIWKPIQSLEGSKNRHSPSSTEMLKDKYLNIAEYVKG